MARITLGKRPKTFNHTIKIQLPEGGEGSIQWVFKYRTRKEFGEFIDGLFASAGTKPDEDVDFSLAKLMDQSVEANADYLLKIAEGWNLDEEFSRQSLIDLCNELPGAALATMNAYRAACTEGRLGN